MIITPRKSARAFTLIELLVVIGIIVLLIGLVVPVILASYRKAAKTRVAADMASIGVALEAYKADFGDYPRVEQKCTGFAVLCKALISPGPGGGPLPAWPIEPYPAGAILSTGDPNSPNGNYKEHVCFAAPDAEGGFSTPNDQNDANTWREFPVSDGKDGPGFKARVGGKPYGAYLDPAKFRVQGMAMRDAWDHPILYFPARPGKVAQDTTTGKTWVLINDTASASPPPVPPIYDAADNISFFLRVNEALTTANDRTKARQRMEALLVADCEKTGGKNLVLNGVINSYAGGTETAVTTAPYLLWSAGPDGRFGPEFDATGAAITTVTLRKCDDVFNFER